MSMMDDSHVEAVDHTNDEEVTTTTVDVHSHHGSHHHSVDPDSRMVLASPSTDHHHTLAHRHVQVHHFKPDVESPSYQSEEPENRRKRNRATIADEILFLQCCKDQAVHAIRFGDTNKVWTAVQSSYVEALKANGFDEEIVKIGRANQLCAYQQRYRKLMDSTISGSIRNRENEERFPEFFKLCAELLQLKQSSEAILKRRSIKPRNNNPPLLVDEAQLSLTPLPHSHNESMSLPTLSLADPSSSLTPQQLKMTRTGDSLSSMPKRQKHDDEYDAMSPENKEKESLELTLETAARMFEYALDRLTQLALLACSHLPPQTVGDFADKLRRSVETSAQKLMSHTVPDELLQDLESDSIVQTSLRVQGLND